MSKLEPDKKPEVPAFRNDAYREYMREYMRAYRAKKRAERIDDENDAAKERNKIT